MGKFLKMVTLSEMSKTKAIYHRLIEIKKRVKFLQHISGHKNIIKVLNKDPKMLLTLNIKINVSYTCIEERLITTSKIILFQPSHSSSGSEVARAHPCNSRHKVGTHPGQDALPLPDTHTHTHSDWSSIDTIPWTCTPSGCGRKPEDPDETHTDMGRTWKLHTDSGPAEN